MKKSILMMSLLLVSQVTFAGYTRTVVATCNEIIDGNIGDVAEKKITAIKDIEVVSYTSNGPDSNVTIETQDYLSGFNLDCAKRPTGLRSTSDCRSGDDVIMIRHTKKSLFTEAITQAHYDMYSKQLHFKKTESSLSQTVLVDVVLQCK